MSIGPCAPSAAFAGRAPLQNEHDRERERGDRDVVGDELFVVDGLERAPGDELLVEDGEGHERKRGDEQGGRLSPREPTAPRAGEEQDERERAE